MSEKNFEEKSEIEPKYELGCQGKDPNCCYYKGCLLEVKVLNGQIVKTGRCCY